jgi:hypothetical protein
MRLECLTAAEVAARLGCSDNSVGRAARAMGLGVYAGGKLVGIVAGDVPAIAGAIHARPGNPNWVAAPAARRVRRRAKA